MITGRTINRVMVQETEIKMQVIEYIITEVQAG